MTSHSSGTARTGPTGPLPGTEDPTAVDTAGARALSAGLFRRLGSLEEGTAPYPYVRDTLVELNLSLVRYAAGRFRRSGEPWEDIVQVGTVGLIKAIDRFDPGRGCEFTTFALPTVVGEIRRHLRDTGWSVHVPRRLQELRLRLAKAGDALEQERGRPPTDAELAARLRVTEELVREGRLAANGFAARSLDVPVDDENGGPGPLARRLGAEDESFERIEDLVALRPLVAALGDRDRAVLALRFGGELTQAEIGARLGISQMHVSRLLSRVLGDLRTALVTDRPPRPAPPAPGAAPRRNVPPAGPPRRTAPGGGAVRRGTATEPRAPRVTARGP